MADYGAHIFIPHPQHWACDDLLIDTVDIADTVGGGGSDPVSPIMVFDGTAWVPRPLLVHNGTEWVPA